MATQITENFTYEEFEHSVLAEDYGIKNALPSEKERQAVRRLCECVLQPLRDLAGVPLIVSSGYRCKAVNDAVGGVESSQHRKGEAADIQCELEPVELARLAYNTPAMWGQVDQMILYPTFVHFSHKQVGTQRQQLLYNKSYEGERVDE